MTTEGRGRVIVRGILVAGVATGIFLALAYRERFDVSTLESWVAEAGAAGPLVFVGMYAAATVLFLPGSVLTLAAGALFGPWWGAFYSLGGATLGAALAFLIARYLASDWVQGRIGPRLGRLMRGVEAEGWRFVAFVRLVPLFPFNALNYGLGITRIPFVSYLLATGVFMLPGALAYAWLGFAGREAVAGGEGLIRNGLIALALLAAVLFLPRLARRLRAHSMLEVDTLAASLQSDDPPLVLDVRTEADFNGEQGHIRGALHLPFDDLSNRLAELGHDFGRPLVVLSCNGGSATAAAALLARQGFVDVHVLRGGMTAWRKRSGPVE